MPQSMLSTSSVHNTVSFPPVLPCTGAPTPDGFSELELELPPPQPVRTAPASASARNAPFSIRCIGDPSFRRPPPVDERRPPIVTRARAGGDDECCRGAKALLTGQPTRASFGRRDS